MRRGQTLLYFLLLLCLVKYVYPFQLFITKTKSDTTQNVEYLPSFSTKPYKTHLFQTRYLTMRILPDDLRRHAKNNDDIVGFKFQLRSSNPDVVIIRKELMTAMPIAKSNHSNTILLEDLYILPRGQALNQIFNAYPSPTLHRFRQNVTNDSNIDTVWSLEGHTMGVTNLIVRLDIFYENDTSTPHFWSLSILVSQPKRVIDKIFMIILPFMVVALSILMGILLNPSIILEIFKHPTAVLVGFIAQYGLMPFLAMAIAKLFHYTPLNSLALFVIGCCPGSGASNQWTVIFDGDVNLSAVMSFVSTIASFVMMPLYFYTFGQLYMKELAISVPFLGLARSLLLVVVPYSIGIGISHCFSNARTIVAKLIKPLMVCLMLFFLTFGLMVNWYLFRMIDLYTALTAPLLPFLGFIIGGLLAWMSCMSWKHIKTIGIEAGIQNTSIAFMVILYSFPEPYATQALIIPLVVSLLTTKPFWIIYLVRKRIMKYKKQKEELAATNNADGKLILTNGEAASHEETNDEQEKHFEKVPDRL